MQQNAVSPFPSSPYNSNDYSTQASQIDSAPVPSQPEIAPTIQADTLPSNLDSGIDPVAPFTNDEAVERVQSAADARPTPSAATSTSAQDPALSAIDAPTPSAEIKSGADIPVDAIEPSPLGHDMDISDIQPSTPQAQILEHPELPQEAVTADHLVDHEGVSTLDGTTDVKPEVESVDQEMSDVPRVDTGISLKVARPREEDDAEEPSAKRPKTESLDAGLDSEAQSSPVLPTTETADVAPPDVAGSTPVPALPEPTATVVQGRPTFATEAAPVAEWGTLTEVQEKQLKQHLQNLKKGRHAAAFTKPVDYVALNIPSYPEIIKNPMDLGKMDRKLKDGQYGSVAHYINDFNLIVDNCMTFNGAAHVISQAAQALRAQFQAGLRRVPKAGEGAASVESKKRRNSLGPLPQRDVKPREPRVSLGAPQTPNGTNQTFAMPPDGNPLIRRTSTGMDARPKREIHKPAPRDLPYSSAKPKKKKYQLELKFSEHVLGELKKGRYSHLMYPFKLPVDPVALNIPNYYKLIKKPMDFNTITDKLAAGHYEQLKEFEADVRLVFENCVKFNGPTHPVSQLAKQLETHFDQELSQKSNWMAANAPTSAPQSPDAESDDYDEEEEEEEEVNEDRDEAIKSIHQQIAELSKKAMALSSGPAVPKKVVKDNKKGGKLAKSGSSKSHRKSLPTPARPEKKASKPKPPKPVKILSSKEKEEISERIGELSGEETGKAAELIKAGLRKVGRNDLADRPDEELEFDIDAIPNDVLYQLLMLVRRGDPGSDYRPVSQVKTSTNGASKHKKHKPMGKSEQEAAVARLQGQIQQFGSAGTPLATAGSCEYSYQILNNHADCNIATESAIADASDDDDDDDGSESEEE